MNVIGWGNFETKVSVLGPDSDQLGRGLDDFMASIAVVNTCHDLVNDRGGKVASPLVHVDYVIISVIVSIDCE